MIKKKPKNNSSHLQNLLQVVAPQGMGCAKHFFSKKLLLLCFFFIGKHLKMQSLPSSNCILKWLNPKLCQPIPVRTGWVLAIDACAHALLGPNEDPLILWHIPQGLVASFPFQGGTALKGHHLSHVSDSLGLEDTTRITSEFFLLLALVFLWMFSRNLFSVPLRESLLLNF